ncbi:MAG: DUF4372 domain-containing protein [Kiritimatiellae bacterium]|nr:DUF4372 domain-containing protein [Kiritimatiellia bacterium]
MKKYTMLKQICNLIPGHLVNKLAKEYGVDEKSRTFLPWSHVVALVYAHLTHAIGLNDVCDALQMNRGALSTMRGATPPSRIVAIVEIDGKDEEVVFLSSNPCGKRNGYGCKTADRDC